MLPGILRRTHYMEGMAPILACKCIMTIFRTDSILGPILTLWWLKNVTKLGFPAFWNQRMEWNSMNRPCVRITFRTDEILVMVWWFPTFGAFFTKWSNLGVLGIFWRTHGRDGRMFRACSKQSDYLQGGGKNGWRSKCILMQSEYFQVYTNYNPNIRGTFQRHSKYSDQFWCTLRMPSEHPECTSNRLKCTWKAPVCTCDSNWYSSSNPTRIVLHLKWIRDILTLLHFKDCYHLPTTVDLHSGCDIECSRIILSTCVYKTGSYNSKDIISQIFDFLEFPSEHGLNICILVDSVHVWRGL